MMRQATQSHPTLKVGQSDKAVKYLKRRMGLSNRHPKYGKSLQRRIIRFERRHGMRFDHGKVNGATWRKLGVPYSTSATLLREAARHAGKLYAYGGNGPDAFDCSGYTRYVFDKVGTSLPRTAAQQRGAARWVRPTHVRPGDLVFVHNGSYVSHVAIYAGNNMWWESSRPGRPVGKNRAWTNSVSYGRI